uniref:Cupredoxin n=1 Tax=Echinococcus granulosus TaxID=6210 RepID=A0A068W7H6_ECHGR|nr:cupredoxin [Echinococcus granulosus]
MTTSKLTTYSIIISGIIIILCTNFCTNAKTHLIYWSPLNIIFRVKPAAVLHVEQRDRVIFVCPKDEYFILWTYKKHAFDNCSNPIDNGNTVNILYRCSFRDPINTAVPKGVNLSEMNIWLPQMPVTNRSFAATASTSLAFRRARLPSVARQPRGPAKRSAGRVEGETFTLLINEFAWSTGTPSFQKDRPVYFTAQPKICLEENMRLTIVQGEIARSRDDAIPQRGLALKIFVLQIYEAKSQEPISHPAPIFTLIQYVHKKLPEKSKAKIARLWDPSMKKPQNTCTLHMYNWAENYVHRVKRVFIWEHSWQQLSALFPVPPFLKHKVMFGSFRESNMVKNAKTSSTPSCKRPQIRQWFDLIRCAVLAFSASCHLHD